MVLAHSARRPVPEPGEYPRYRRPAQYGAVEGSLGDLGCQLSIMPWNTEDAGSAMLRIRPQAGLAGGALNW
jgi:hypothetical protein